MIPALQLAQICQDAYADAPAGFDRAWNFSGCISFHRKLDDVDVIVFRGSKSAQDWLADAEAMPLWDPRIGFVHAGFMCGVNDTLAAVALACGPKLIMTGHSLGGARARILAGLLAYSGRPVIQCCVFGSPRPAFANVGRILQKSGTPLASYRNCNDPVPLVPFMGGLYVHPDQWIALEAHSAPDDLDPLRDHKITKYIAGLQASAS